MGLLLAGAGFAVAAPAFAAGNESATVGQTQTMLEECSEQPLAVTPATVPGGGSGVMIYVDPKTGQLLKEPAPGTAPLAVSPALDNARSTSHQGLVEVPSPVPGGGVEVDLQGRFQSPLIGTIDADGKLRMHHLHETVGSVDPK
jgi:hypothetical protein